MATRDYQDVFVNEKFLGRNAEKAEIKNLLQRIKRLEGVLILLVV